MTKESPKLTIEETAPGVSAGHAPRVRSSFRDSRLPDAIQPEHPEDAPPGWVDVQEELAESLNLAILLVNGRQPPALALSNNNSICAAFQSSPEFVRLCDPYCGDAHRRATSAGSAVRYKCHAGLQCVTMPVQIGRNQGLAVIGGRAFLDIADYRTLVDRFRAGELNDLLNRQPFDNVIFSESQRLEQLSQRLEKATRKFGDDRPKSNVQRPKSEQEAQSTTARAEALLVEVVADFAESMGGEGSLDVSEIEGAGLDSPGSPTEAVGSELMIQGPRAHAAGSDLIIQEPPAYAGGSDMIVEPAPSGRLHLVVEAQTASQPDLQMEIDRLRTELEYRTNLAHSLQSFLERISSTDPDKTYNLILTHSRELLQAERASLWVFDEGSNEIILRAAAGFVDAQKDVGRLRIGEGISGRVLEAGKPLMTDDLLVAGLTPAAAERKYKTNSFISYPITMGGRKIGVLNVTDKADGHAFDSVDLSLLDVIAPQIAVALERAEWQERATQFQLMSITDPLTGLLNRRYLEERLTEELNRSKRYSYPMSCLMIDIDDFKSYNDRNGHQAGDVALKITAHSLKAALRSADIACRYGGEEFCILLPQTNLSEAGVIAERMRQKVTETDYPYGKSQPRGTVSISIGISTFGKHIDTPDSVIAAADRALYNAKHLGKNRIEFYVDNLIATR
ncbi:MAG TPA: diguanylate cyclase [Pyrinomonadaceae bacterium]|nr:diguanylate cyclase [Pyrinomonadaceae bacterium]